MSDGSNKVALSPVVEGLVGAGIGGVLGIILSAAGLISPIAIIGVIAGVGLGSFFNAWWRGRKNKGN